MPAFRARPAPPADDPKKRALQPAAEDNDKPPREKKKPCFGPSVSVETLEAIESRFLGATLPLQ